MPDIPHGPMSVAAPQFRTIPDKAARERPCAGAMSTSCWCIVCPNGLMMEPEKRSKIGLLREAKAKLRASAHPRRADASFCRFAAGGSLQGLEHSSRRLKRSRRFTSSGCPALSGPSGFQRPRHGQGRVQGGLGSSEGQDHAGATRGGVQSNEHSGRRLIRIIFVLCVKSVILR
jgi:hypothetical protein